MATPPYSFTAMALILRAVWLLHCPISAMLTNLGDTLKRCASIRPVPFFVQTFLGDFSISVCIDFCCIFENSFYNRNTLQRYKRFRHIQQKMQKNSPIKERILQFADSLNISKREFYKKTGISRGTLESSTGITEDTLAKFIATFEDLSPEWILTGKGEMLRNTTTANNQANDDKVSRLITILQDTLAEKDKQIDQLLKIINRISSNTNNKQI